MSDVRPPVEQMSDLSWARVERGLWARLDGTATTQIAAPPSRRWLWIALPSAAVAAAAAIAFVVFVKRPMHGLPSAPIATAPVAEETPMRVVTGDAPSTITVGDAHVTLASDSAVVMPRANEAAVLEKGSATFAIAPRTGRQFVVVAGDAVVRVIGTKFSVARFDERVTVAVERGVVDVTFQGATTKVTAGQIWDSQPKHVITPAKQADVALPKRAKPTTTSAADDDRAKYETARDSEARDPAGALAGYLEVARGNSRWAELSLYAAARLSADRGEARAKTLLDMYLRRFPRGANAADARQLLDRLKGAP